RFEQRLRERGRDSRQPPKERSLLLSTFLLIRSLKEDITGFTDGDPHAVHKLFVLLVDRYLQTDTHKERFAVNDTGIRCQFRPCFAFGRRKVEVFDGIYPSRAGQSFMPLLALRTSKAKWCCHIGDLPFARRAIGHRLYGSSGRA